MDAASVAKTLHPLEVRILLKYDSSREIDAQTVRKDLGYREGQENQAFSWLSGKGLIEESARSLSVLFEITPLGLEYAEKGTPEERIFDFLERSAPVRLPELAEKLGLEQKSIGSAFGLLSKEGTLKMDEEKRAVRVEASTLPARLVVLRKLLKRASEEGGILAEASLDSAEISVVQSVAKKRGAGDAPFRIAEREKVAYRFTLAATAVRERSGFARHDRRGTGRPHPDDA